MNLKNWTNTWIYNFAIRLTGKITNKKKYGNVFKKNGLLLIIKYYIDAKLHVT